MLIDDFINNMSIQYRKVNPVYNILIPSCILYQGHFILAASFNESYNFGLFPGIGTDMGLCKTIKPMVSCNVMIRKGRGYLMDPVRKITTYLPDPLWKRRAFLFDSFW